MVILTQYFPPEVGAPQHRLGYLARRLRGMGHDVTVVTGMPNYPRGRVLEGWRGRLFSREHTEFGTVVRSWLYTSSRRTIGRQMLSYASFALLSGISAPLRVRRADVILWESPPLSLAPAAWLLARRARARLVMNVSDLWPRSAVDLGLLEADSIPTRAFERLESWAYGVADLVSCQTEGIATGVRDRRPTTRTCLFPNGVDLSLFRPCTPNPVVRRSLGATDGSILVGYVGNFGRAQALEQLIEAAPFLAQRAPNVCLVLLGDGPRRPEIERLIRMRGIGNVVIADPVPHAQVPTVLSALDVGLVLLADRDVFRGARPSKLFEFLAVGLPVVYAGRGEGAGVAAASGACEVVEPERPDALAAAVARLARLGRDERQAMGQRGQDFVGEGFDRIALTDAFVAELVAVGSRAR